MKKNLIINGCDAGFYSFMESSLDSLVNLGLDNVADIAILDLGLTHAQVAILRERGFIVKKPEWALAIPKENRKEHQLGLVARTFLREYFPGYEVYLWFDADAWAQTPEFFHELTEGARKYGAGVIFENGAGYKKDFVYAKWWYGNMIAAYGLIKGLKIAVQPVINIGILALSATAPHWDSWIKYYKIFIEKRKKANNQHSFNAAVVLDKLPYYMASARCNWITVLSDPTWNPQTRMLCEPNQGSKPLSVIHLAGPNKGKVYNLRQTSGGMHQTSLTYKTIISLQ